MKLFPAAVEIGPDEGFSPAKDIFGRKKIGDGLTHLVQSVEDPLVIAVDGAWGSGKTTFLKMWRGELSNLGFPVIYFDAFANDYFEDAFIPIAAEIIGLAEAKLSEKKGKLEEFTDKAKKVIKVLARSGLKLGINAGTLGMLDAGQVEGAIAKEFESLFDKHVGELITKQATVKSDMEAFRLALHNLPGLFRSAVEEEGPARPIVVIIDELDRCRPVYALQLLERMKHFFSVSGVHFVLGTNLEQLSSSVSFAYGAGVNGRLYLQKFINLRVALYDNFDTRKETTAARFIKHLATNQKLENKDSQFIAFCAEDLTRLSKLANLDLRSIEQAFGHILRVIATTPDNHFRNPALIVGLIFLKLTAPQIFDKAKRGDLRYHEVVQHFLILDVEDRNIDPQQEKIKNLLREQHRFARTWRYFTDENCPQDVLSAFREQGFSSSYFDTDERLGTVSWCANEQIDRFVPIGK